MVEDRVLVRGDHNLTICIEDKKIIVFKIFKPNQIIKIV